MAIFSLNARLSNDCITVGDFPLCRLLLMNDALYPWFILVPRIAGVEELHELAPDQQHQLMDESSQLSRVLKQQFNAEKLNVAVLGNIVRQLHIHHVVRFSQDKAWPGPIWGRFPAEPYKPEAISLIVAGVVEKLGNSLMLK